MVITLDPLIGGAMTMLYEQLAHDLSTPVNFLSSIVERATAGRLVPAVDLEIAAQEVARLKTLRAALRAARPLVVQPRPVKLLDLVQEARSRARLPLVIEAPSGRDATIVADPEIAAANITALAEVAAGALPPGAALTVRIEAGALGPSLRFCAVPAAGPLWPPSCPPWLASDERQLLAQVCHALARAQGFRIVVPDEDRADEVVLELFPEGPAIP